MQQCIAQALSISIRKPQGKPADPTTLLLQLPHVDMDIAKKLRRRKIQTLKGQWLLNELSASWLKGASCEAWI
jgi:preprotein translocase subunit Sec63